MLFRSFQPSPPLNAFVENFWLYDDYAPPQHRDRILPSGTIELVINLRDDELRIYPAADPDRCARYSGALVSGPYGGYFVIDTLQEASLFGVHFKQGGAAPLLGLPVRELADAHCDLETLWGPAAARLREQLCAADSPEARFRVMEETLFARLARSPDLHFAVPAALHAFGQGGGTAPDLRVRDVVQRVGLSERRFIAVFKAEVGMTPKLFCRVQRFQHLLSLLSATPAPDWARLAASCGYFDQSHLIHEFQAFSGFRPGDYLRQQRLLRQQGVHRKRNHVPLIEQGQFFPIAAPDTAV